MSPGEVDYVEEDREKPFKCEECGKSFLHQYRLRNHLRVHTGERPFGCDQCDRAFSVKSNLVLHKRTHTGEKPYKCDFCAKVFACKSNLTLHSRTHTGEKPYSCGLCGKSYAAKVNLTGHVRRHSGQFKCDQCGKLLESNSKLNRHLKLHRDNEWHRCNVCAAEFLDVDDLIRHLQEIHLGRAATENLETRRDPGPPVVREPRSPGDGGFRQIEGEEEEAAGGCSDDVMKFCEVQISGEEIYRDAPSFHHQDSSGELKGT